MTIEPVQTTIVTVKPIQFLFTYPPFGQRRDYLAKLVDGIEVSELSIDEPILIEPYGPIIGDDGLAIDYPYLEMRMIAQRKEHYDQYWLRVSTHIPML